MESVILKPFGHILLHYSILLEGPEVQNEFMGTLSVPAREQHAVGRRKLASHVIRIQNGHLGGFPQPGLACNAIGRVDNDGQTSG